MTERTMRTFANAGVNYTIYINFDITERWGYDIYDGTEWKWGSGLYDSEADVHQGAIDCIMSLNKDVTHGD